MKIAYDIGTGLRVVAVAAAVALSIISLVQSLDANGQRNDPRPTAAGRTEMEKAFYGLQPRPSTDISPIEFSIVGIRYRVPRNYLVTMDNWAGGPQYLVTMRVNLADIKPMTKETQECFTVAPAYRPPGCEPLEFWINGKQGVSTEQAFSNARGLFLSQTPAWTAFGAEKYEMGPETSRIEYYRIIHDQHTSLYTCKIFDNHGSRDGLCDPVSDHTELGNGIRFFFPLRLLPKINVADIDIRKLVDNFAVGDDQRSPR